MRYANRECHDCHGIFSANEMVHASDRVKSGESFTQRKNSAGQWSTPSSKSTRYSNRERLICSACSRKRFLTKLTAGVAAIGVICVFAARPERQHSVTKPPQESARPDVAANGDTAVPLESIVEPPTGNLNRAASLVAPASIGPQYNVDSSADGGGSPKVPQSSQIASSSYLENDPKALPEVGNAIQKAFGSGHSERWQAGKLNGYAVPSKASATGCRNVGYTVDSEPNSPFEPVRVCP